MQTRRPELAEMRLESPELKGVFSPTELDLIHDSVRYFVDDYFTRRYPYRENASQSPDHRLPTLAFVRTILFSRLLACLNTSSVYIAAKILATFGLFHLTPIHLELFRGVTDEQRPFRPRPRPLPSALKYIMALVRSQKSQETLDFFMNSCSWEGMVRSICGGKHTIFSTSREK